MSAGRAHDAGRPDAQALASLLLDEGALADYCARHPTHAARMRAAVDALRELAARTPDGLPTAEPPARTLSDRLRERFGDDVDPSVSLEPEPTPTPPAPARDAASDDSALGRIARRPDGSQRYRVEGQVARGGMGAVLRVWDHDLRRHLAMKVTLGRASGSGRPASAASPHATLDASLVARFLEEAQVTGQLDHPGIVPLHELGLDAEGRVWFTMKLVRGEDLKAVFGRVHRGEPDWTVTRVLGLLQRVCEAMAFAHAKGVVHRDLKPANVMVGRFGEVYVMDWGLARVLGRPDRHDLRLRDDDALPAVRTDRSDAAGDDPGSSLVTMDGDVLGTPAYMPPEQARGEIERIGPAADVYAIGAMLYHLLAGRMPYVDPARPVDARAIVERVRGGPPAALHELAPRAPAELVAICERAMEREPSRRYRDTSALSDDLRAYLEQRVVAAYETGALAELRKWIARNKPLAAALLAVFAIATAGAVVFAALNADLEGSLARERELSDDLAARNDDLGASLARESAALSDAERERERAEENARRADEAAARARDEKERVLRLSAFRELTALRREADALWPVDPDLLPAHDAWLRRADALVAGLDPSPDGADPGHRGQLAELSARALPVDDAEREAALRAHPRFAELAALDAELLAVSRAVDAFRASLGGAPPDDAQAAELVVVEGEIARGRARRAALAAAIEAESGRPRFARDEDAWWYEQLESLVEAIAAFADPDTGLVDGVSDAWGWGVRRRRGLASTLVERTLSGDEARARWSAAVASVGDPSECPAYGGLRLQPQLGLLPLGRDPASGLWEFWHVLSGDEPPRDATGRHVPSDTSGLVLVLLPGGTPSLGSQRDDPDAPFYDPQTVEDCTPVHTVTLSPFFLSKYEMTQGQWQRATGGNPSSYGPQRYMLPWDRDRRGWTATHPVETVSWTDCRRTLARLGLELPSEARWEYACRAGTTTIFSTGDDVASLQGFANVADRFALSVESQFSAWEDAIDDGHVVHAPVGSLRPNAFGLHDMHGNVFEWCLDGYGDDAYRVLGQRGGVDPFIDPEAQASRVFRGGGFVEAAWRARSAYRDDDQPETRSAAVGLRPALSLAAAR